MLRHLFILAFTLLLILPADGFARQFEWPDKSENLTVLPETTSGEELSNVMRSFTSSLGVRCSFCHVGEGPLSDYDFVSDEKQAKEKTRVMMRMTGAINKEYIAELADHEEEPQERLQVKCITCHRNAARPMMLEDLLAETHARGGIEETLAGYEELREAYFGGFAYDFRAGTLTALAQQLAEQGNADDALKVLDREIELHNDHTDAYHLQGNIHAEAGRTAEAIASYELAREHASPRAKGRYKELIDKLKN